MVIINMIKPQTAADNIYIRDNQTEKRVTKHSKPPLPAPQRFLNRHFKYSTQLQM